MQSSCTSTIFSFGSDLSRRHRRARTPRFPTNIKIAESILASKWGRPNINGMVMKVKRGYGLSEEQAEDLRGAAVLRIFEADWRRFLYEGGIRPRLTDNKNHYRLVRVLCNYAAILIRNAVIDETRRHLGAGMKGLTAKPMKEMPFMEGIPEQDSPETEDPTKIEEMQHPAEFIAPDAESVAIAKQCAELAKKVLCEVEFQCVSLAFGFDGGGSRSVHQVAKEMNMPRPVAEKLYEVSMAKLREAVL